MSICRRSCPAPAPRATRVAISRRRSTPWASRMFATFAQAMSSTNPAAPIISSRPTRTPGGVISSSRGVALTPHPAFVSGYSAATWLARPERLPSALSKETSGRRRAITSRLRSSRFRSPGSRRNRRPGLRVFRECPSSGHHSNDRVGFAVDLQALPEDTCASPKPHLPHLMADQAHGRSTGAILLRRERPPQDRLRPQEGEERGGDPGACDAFRLVFGAEVELEAQEGPELAEGRVLLLPGEEAGCRGVVR